MEIMYPGKAFSPFTTLSAGIGATDTNIPVEDISAFPPAPNLATIGTDENAETILYAAIAGNMLSGCERGIEGAARTWSSGNIIGRNFTAEDYGRIIANIGMAATGVNDIKAVNGNIPLTAADIPLGPTVPGEEQQTVKEAIDATNATLTPTAVEQFLGATEGEDGKLEALFRAITGADISDRGAANSVSTLDANGKVIQPPGPMILTPMWTDAVLLNGATSDLLPVVQYQNNIGGRGRVRGYVKPNTTLFPMIFANIPAGFRPDSTRSFFASVYGGDADAPTVIEMLLLNNGNMYANRQIIGTGNTAYRYWVDIEYMIGG